MVIDAYLLKIYLVIIQQITYNYIYSQKWKNWLKEKEKKQEEEEKNSQL